MDLIHDNIKKLFHQFLVPAIGGTLLVTAYSLVDTIAIGQGVGPNGAAACAVLVPILCIGDFLGLLCGTGGAVLLGETKGGGNERKGNEYYTAAFLMVALLTTVTWGAMFFLQEPSYRLFGADDTLLPYTLEYGTVIVLLFPSFVLTGFLACFLRNDGAPNLVMVATLIGAAINIFGDWLFVFPMQLGMFGATLATAISSVIQNVILIGYLFTKRCSLKFVKPIHIVSKFGEITANGFGTAFSLLAVIAVTFVVNNQIMKYADTAALAVYGMIATVSTLFVHIYSGVGQAAQPIASANFGAGQTKRYWEVYQLGMRTILCLGILFTALCELLPTQITTVFIKATPEVLDAALFILRVYAISFLPLGINTFLSIYLQSIMLPKPATIIAVMRGLVLNCILLYLLPLIWKAAGIWIAFAAAEIAVATVGVLYAVKITTAARDSEYSVKIEEHL